ncbi:BTB/POZ and TAZ domain-containing protein 1-like isoform X1 [Papaver somniferum]|uniref:BTB/POZ and TAZ domain-containing protein 1-like isoform X1 n=1 Tax=Papaver somniferum TaxID=3469 RepID=UPI000E704A31|nr:BTB/POZ and TAZ domain-containing protein 1-like isoform X1 [Papaver somniferum]
MEPAMKKPTKAISMSKLIGFDQISTKSDQISFEDVKILTSNGLKIFANSIILGSSSKVLEKILDRPSKYQNSVKRDKKRSRSKEERGIYLELSEAMECLEHICTEGCTNVGPYDREPTKKTGPCEKFSTCQGLQGLIKHFAMCEKRMNGGCCRCKRMGQLLKLHASICDQDDHRCKVPLCSRFKLKNQLDRKSNDGRWRLLVKRVACAKTVSSLSSPKMMMLRRKEEDRCQR